MKYLNPFNSLFGKILLGFWLTVTLVGLGSSWLTRLSFDNPTLIAANEDQIKYSQRLYKKLSKLDQGTANQSKNIAGKINYFVFDEQGRLIPKRLFEQKISRGANDNRKSPRIKGEAESQFDRQSGKPPRPFNDDHRPPKDNDRRGKRHDIPATVIDLFLSEYDQTNPNDTADLYSLYWRGKFWLGMMTVEVNNQNYRIITTGGPKGDNANFLNTPRARLLLTLVVSAVFSFLLAFSFTRPLISLRKTTKALSDGDLEARPSAKILKRGDEYGALARQVHETAEHIEQLLTAQQSLLANVSHELRSPLTRLQLACELAKMKSTADSNELARIELESGRLEAMIAKLLKLSRLENQMMNLEKEQGDLAHLSQQIVDTCRSESDSKKLVVVTEFIDSAKLTMDIEMIHSAIENIYRNAIRFSPDGAELTIKVKQEQKNYLVVVQDQGVGVPESELASMFEAFVKSSTTDNSGVGLGLAIAKQAVQRHGGDIEAKINPAGGLMMIITLPK